MSIMMRLFVFILMPCRDLIVLRLLDRSTLTYRPVSLSFSKYSETARLGSYSLAVVPWWRQFPTHSAFVDGWLSWMVMSAFMVMTTTITQFTAQPDDTTVRTRAGRWRSLGLSWSHHLWTSSKILSLLLIRLWTASHDGCWEWSNGMRK